MYIIKAINGKKGKMYCVKFRRDGWEFPTDGKAYKTLEKALATCKEKGIDIQEIEQ